VSYTTRKTKGAVFFKLLYPGSWGEEHTEFLSTISLTAHTHTHTHTHTHSASF
jgi:hypothetical protein